MKKLMILVISAIIISIPVIGTAQNQDSILIHLKTGLKHDDAQICVAYNMIWAALDKGLKVDVLIDADAVNTFKIGWRGKNSIEGYPLPERLRKSLAKQFDEPLANVPKNYGHFIGMLKERGADFYINTAFLVLAKIEEEMGTVENISPKFVKPVTLKEMLALRTGADHYMAY